MDVDNMINELSRIKKFQDMDKKSDAERMELMLEMMGGANPEMKNMMNMMRMMTAMQKGGAGPMDMMSAFSPQAGPVTRQSVPEDKPAPEEPTPPSGESADRGDAGTPLKPVTKIANKDITYMLNRYINR